MCDRTTTLKWPIPSKEISTDTTKLYDFSLAWLMKIIQRAIFFTLSKIKNTSDDDVNRIDKLDDNSKRKLFASNAQIHIHSVYFSLAVLFSSNKKCFSADISCIWVHSWVRCAANQIRTKLFFFSVARGEWNGPTINNVIVRSRLSFFVCSKPSVFFLSW